MLTGEYWMTVEGKTVIASVGMIIMKTTRRIVVGRSDDGT
jgi:hypothetical protein